MIPSLHYGLRREGYLVLGRSESIAGFTELFEAVDKKQKVFRKLSPASAAELFRFRATLREQPPRRRDTHGSWRTRRHLQASPRPARRTRPCSPASPRRV